MSERPRHRRKKRGEPRVMFLHKIDDLCVLVDAFQVFDYHSEKKMVGFHKEWQDPALLAQQFRVPCIDDGIQLRAKNWAHVSPQDAAAMWERGLRVSADDLIAVAIKLDV